jgi:hypothetical protein
VRTLEDSTLLLLVIAVSLIFAWILWPFFNAVLGQVDVFNSQGELPRTVVLHLILGASFGHIIPRATIPHAILLALCVLHISREGWPCEDWARKEKC